jgi:hypothetical protein
MQLLPGFIISHVGSMAPAFLYLIPEISRAFGHWPAPKGSNHLRAKPESATVNAAHILRFSGPLGFHRAVAERAVKVATILDLDNFKSFGHAIDLCVPR